MKAIVYHAPGHICVEDIPIPRCGEGELLVKVDACAICGSDLKTFHYGNPRIKAPLVMGHEFTGIVEEIGRGAEGYQAGDQIVMATSISCGECYYCRRGWNNLCMKLSPVGFAYPGGMAEYIVVPALAVRNGHVVKTPRYINPEHATLAEPISCAVNSLENCRIEPGDTVVVLGAGPMGLINACVVRGLGAEKIILSEVNPLRLVQAQQFEIDVLVNPDKRDLAQAVKEATGGLGADVAIVAAPAARPQEMALQLVRKHGTVCLFASLPVGSETLSINSRLIHYGELHVLGVSDSTPVHVRKAVDLIVDGRIPADKLVTHVLPLDDIFRAFELMRSGESLRVVLRPLW